MGKSNDPMAVVDSKAKVIGVRDLRVVDASSFALLPPGHPLATVCRFPIIVLSASGQTTTWLTYFVDALAEKIADDIALGN